MIPYPDAGFLLTLLIVTGGTSTAREVLRIAEPPFKLNALHQLQVESFLLQLEKAGQAERRRAGATGTRLWRWYFSEELFELSEVDWTAAFQSAITWNTRSKAAPPPPLLILHPVIAAITRSTHFVSFDPRSRLVATQLGLKILPQKL